MRSPKNFLVLSCFALFLPASCTLITDVDRSKIPGSNTSTPEDEAGRANSGDDDADSSGSDGEGGAAGAETEDSKGDEAEGGAAGAES